ncbi:hypothetical protein ACGFNY_44010 [Streptomyces chartreusis]|uniref:hypothetical protein n=1 Tax=Streptomyces chartreusis TaxID=1969 RepID=UPI003721A59E
MNLGDIITRLEAANPQQVVKHGFHNPHSYRGDYYDLAFEPATDITVADMLEAARSAVGATYQGWKGGDFKMNEYDWCWLSEEGTASGETISPLLLEFMLTPPAERSAVLHSAADDLAAMRIGSEDPDPDGHVRGYNDGLDHAEAELRRMADEAQQQPDTETREETGAALARYIADRPVSEIQAAFRILGWPPLRFALVDIEQPVPGPGRVVDEENTGIEYRGDCSACRHTEAGRD